MIDTSATFALAGFSAPLIAGTAHVIRQDNERALVVASAHKKARQVIAGPWPHSDANQLADEINRRSFAAASTPGRP